MGWLIPDIGTGDADLQSILFSEYLQVLVDGIDGRNCVLSGCAVTGGADMTPAVAKGSVLSDGVLHAVSAGDVTIGTADATHPRIDLIVADSTGAKQVRAGTAAADPKPPARSANDVVLYAVYVPAADTSIETTKLIDLRVTRTQGPIVIAKQTAARSQANSTAAVSLFATAPTIPDGLFLAGKVIRVRAGGNVLHNTTTTMTITLQILYGGTVIFQDLSVAYGTTADADRMAWWMTYDLIAQANAVQVMHGYWSNAGATVTAPNTGIGDISLDEHLGNSPIGSAEAGIAVNSDTGDRVLDIQFTMSAANANHAWTCQGITVELL